MAAKFIMIASSKGGVGKSTVALGIARALKERGKRVLLCDLDVGNACLDILLGVQDLVICTLQDAMEGRSPVERALIEVGETHSPKAKRGIKKKSRAHSETGVLWLLPSTAGGAACISTPDGDGIVDSYSPAIVRTLCEAAEVTEADFVIIDTGAGVNMSVDAAAEIADTALVVTGQMPVALRSAESTVARLASLSVKDVKLVINSFDADGVIEDARKGLFAVIDQSRAPLAGVVPYDYSLLLTHEGLFAEEGDSQRAFANIAARLLSENVPLFSGIRRIRRLKKKICK